MNLQTKYFIEGGVCLVDKENKNDITKSIKLTAKYKINMNIAIKKVDDYYWQAKIDNNELICYTLNDLVIQLKSIYNVTIHLLTFNNLN